jgi:hypothetical protein
MAPHDQQVAVASPGMIREELVLDSVAIGKSALIFSRLGFSAARDAAQTLAGEDTRATPLLI